MSVILNNLSYLLLIKISILIFFFIFFLNYYKSIFKITFFEIISILLLHFIFLFIFHSIFDGQNNDAFQYYMYCNPSHDQYFEPFLNYKSTENMIWLVQSICKYLDNNLLFNATFFNLIGSVGIIILYATLKEIDSNKKNFFLLLSFILFPSIFFWTSTIGKEAIAFTAISIILWSLKNISINRNKFLFLFSLFFLFISKPYIFIIVIFCIIILLILSKNISIFLKISILLIFLPPLYYICSLIVQYITGYDIFTFIHNLDNWYYSFKNVFASSNSFVDDHFFIKLFYIFTLPPIFFSYNLSFLISSLENMYFLILAFYILILIPKSNFKPINPFITKFCLLFIFCMILFYALTIFNIGVFVRQKIYILPFIFYLFYERIIKN